MPGIFRRPLFWLVVLGVIVAGGVAFMISSQAAAKKAQAAAASKKVDSPYAAIAAGKVDVEGGVIQVAARTAGVVREVLVQEGAQVKKGDILARLEDDQLRLAANQARASADQARAQIAQLEVSRVAADRELKRLVTLQAKDFAAASVVDKQRDALASANAGIAAQRAAVATAQATLASTSYQLELTTVRAPADGRIVRRYANPGSGASTLNVSNMFDLEPNTTRIVRAELAESDLPNVTVGQDVEILPDSDPLHPWHGKVLRRAYQFGARKLLSDDPTERTDERVVEVVASAEGAPFLIGQRVLVKFIKPGRKAEAPAPAKGATATDKAAH
jgi:HlyD family secretion protein